MVINFIALQIVIIPYVLALFKVLFFRNLKTREHQEPARPQHGRVIEMIEGSWIGIQQWRDGPSQIGRWRNGPGVMDLVSTEVKA